MIVDHKEYRREIHSHAAKLGFTGGRKRGPYMFFRHPLSNRVVKIEYAPNVGSGLIHHARHRKGILTTEHRSATYTAEPVQVPREDDPRRMAPSQNYWGDWLFAQHDPTMPTDGDGDDRAGKWLVFLRRGYVDEVWRAVRDATLQGRLSITAKISTRKNAPIGEDLHVLCVYTADSNDIDDVMRVREMLRELGFKRKISYKPNAMTRALVHGSSFSA